MWNVSGNLLNRAGQGFHATGKYQLPPDEYIFGTFSGQLISN